MTNDMTQFHESMQELRKKIETFMRSHGNSMGKMDKRDFSEILEKPGFHQDRIAIVRILAWNAQVYSYAPELDPENVAWAKAFKVSYHAPAYPHVYNLDMENLDKRWLNDMISIAREYVRNASDAEQGRWYKTAEDVRQFASHPEEALKHRMGQGG